MAQIIEWEKSFNFETYRAGSYGQFSGKAYHQCVEIGALLSDFDSPIKSVYFGDNEGQQILPVGERDLYTTSRFWMFKFLVAERIMGQKTSHTQKGKYHIVTEKGTDYVFDNNGQEYIYDTESYIRGLDECKNDLL